MKNELHWQNLAIGKPQHLRTFLHYINTSFSGSLDEEEYRDRVYIHTGIYDTVQDSNFSLHEGLQLTSRARTRCQIHTSGLYLDSRMQVNRCITMRQCLQAIRKGKCHVQTQILRVPSTSIPHLEKSWVILTRGKKERKRKNFVQDHISNALWTLAGSSFLILLSIYCCKTLKLWLISIYFFNFSDITANIKRKKLLWLVVKLDFADHLSQEHNICRLIPKAQLSYIFFWW